MAKNYKVLAEEIINLIGGKENVENVFHCATRLRFNLKNLEKARENTEAIEKTEGVIQVIVQNSQYQIVIGPDVSKAFAEVRKIIGEDQMESTSIEESSKQDKTKSDKFFEAVSGIFTPIVPVLMASGMMGALVTILKLTGVVTETNPTYYLMNIVYEAGFYFLPFFIAFSSSRVFKANPFLSMLLAGIMLHPNVLNFADHGVKSLNFLSIAVPTIDYSRAVLPVILGVWLLSYLERLFNKFYPDIVRAFMAPLSVMLVILPIQLIVIGPLGHYIAGFLGSGVVWLGDNLGFFAVGILAFFTPLMIVTGTHSFAFPVIVATLTSIGYDQLLMPSMLAENLAMAGSAFACALIAKDKKKRSEGLSASLTAALGISEPAMYGVNLPSKYGFIGAMLGGLVGGIFAGIFKFKMFMIASSSIVGIPAMINDDGIQNLIIGLLTIVISFVASALFTWGLAKSSFDFNKIMKRRGKDYGM